MKNTYKDTTENTTQSEASTSESVDNECAADALIIYDRSSRRRFIRTGTAFLFAGGAASFSGGVLANDCDRAPNEENPKQAGNGSDSDSGSEADPEGCGRKLEKPKISLRRPSGADESPKLVEETVSVVKVLG